MYEPHGARRTVHLPSDWLQDLRAASHAFAGRPSLAQQLAWLLPRVHDPRIFGASDSGRIQPAETVVPPRAKKQLIGYHLVGNIRNSCPSYSRTPQRRRSNLIRNPAISLRGGREPMSLPNVFDCRQRSRLLPTALAFVVEG